MAEMTTSKKFYIGNGDEVAVAVQFKHPLGSTPPLRQFLSLGAQHIRSAWVEDADLRNHFI